TTLQMLRNTLTVRWKKGQPRPGAPSLKHPYKCFFWGAISVHGTIRFHLWDNQNLDGALYRWIIRAKLLRQANKKMGKCWRFQHDNDPKHTANATKEEHGIEVLNWPPNSPDLNPIENLWAWMKRKVEEGERRMMMEGKLVGPAEFRGLVMKAWRNV